MDSKLSVVHYKLRKYKTSKSFRGMPHPKQNTASNLQPSEPLLKFLSHLLPLLLEAAIQNTAIEIKGNILSADFQAAMSEDHCIPSQSVTKVKEHDFTDYLSQKHPWIREIKKRFTILVEEWCDQENYADVLMPLRPSPIGVTIMFDIGVTIMFDSCSDIMNRSLITILINNTYGAIFLKSIKTSDHANDTEFIFGLFDGVLEEIREHLGGNRDQVDGEEKTPMLDTPCRALYKSHSKKANLPQNKNVLTKTKKIGKFIYNHSWILTLMRKFSKKELLWPTNN
ncbi:hypothetical protein M5K25_015677 [Dendrobium thyrsiflorum]|uniref:DUF659 domain-containing protein n=1 Tax=Dendrobium thyrsiflorum TaxID=117978 RepID=A0ABD0UQX9_DENTH